MAASWFGSLDPPNTRLWRDHPRPASGLPSDRRHPTRTSERNAALTSSKKQTKKKVRPKLLDKKSPIQAVYGAAFRRYGKSLRVLPVLEKGEVSARALCSRDRGTSGRWHIHCAIELPSHFDGIAFENLIGDCWAKVEWSHGRILVRDGANAGWINYMLKDRQKSEFDGFVDCIIIESLHNPIADA